jgi:polyhydroxybutyrate depolymerase
MPRLSFMCPVLLVAAAGCWDASSLVTADAAVADPDARSIVDGGSCGQRTNQRGKTTRSVTAGGIERTYIVYLPPDADPTTPLPLVFVHHGYTMSAQAMYEITGYPALADIEGIALAFPDGQGGPNSFGAPWNVGTGSCPASNGGTPPSATGDDFAMLDAIEADIANDQCIDSEHVFVTGFSMGGYFSHHAGCMDDSVRAIAPHSGGTHSFDTCTTGHKPVIIFHGTADAIVPSGCDDPAAAFKPIGVTPSATAWAAKNGCGTTTSEVAVDGGTCLYYDGCPADGQVALCRFPGMGHCWAGGVGPSIYACPSYEDATALEWAFFKQHAW